MHVEHTSKKLADFGQARFVKGANSCKLNFCEYCVMGKYTRVKFSSIIHNTKGILDCVHSDVRGLARVASLGSMHYFFYSC